MRPIVVITEWILGDDGRCYSPTARLVALALAKHADGQGRAWPGQERLADLVGIQVRSLRKILSELTATDGPFVKGLRRGPHPTIYTIRALPTARTKTAPGDADIPQNDRAVECHMSAPYGPNVRAVECPPNKEEQSMSSPRRRDAASRHVPRQQTEVQEAHRLWTEKLGFVPTWETGKKSWSILHMIRRRAGKEFLPAVRSYLATDTDFYRNRGWPPALLLSDLDGILRKVRKAEATTSPRRFPVREMQT